MKIIRGAQTKSHRASLTVIFYLTQFSFYYNLYYIHCYSKFVHHGLYRQTGFLFYYGIYSVMTTLQSYVNDALKQVNKSYLITGWDSSGFSDGTSKDHSLVCLFVCCCLFRSEGFGNSRSLSHFSSYFRRVRTNTCILKGHHTVQFCTSACSVEWCWTKSHAAHLLWLKSDTNSKA